MPVLVIPCQNWTGLCAKAGLWSAIERSLPDAVIVVDHFHLVQVANQGRDQGPAAGHPPGAGPPRYQQGSSLGEPQAAAARTRAPLRPGLRPDANRDPREATGELLAAWIAKEELRYLLAVARTHPAQSDVSNRLFAFYDWCARADVPEVTTLARTIEAWWPQILAFLDTGITNAVTEANNRLIKDAARIAFGFRNLDNQRRRVPGTANGQ